MKAALAATPPHDFPFPSEEVAKVAGCSRGYEYFLKGTEPQSGCGASIDETQPDDVAPAAAGIVEPPQPPVQATPTALLPPTAEP
jgi:hypothetical protein